MDNRSVLAEGCSLVASVDDLALEPKARDPADLLEFRMDLAAGDPVTALRNYEGELPVIATNRVRGEGGEAPDETDRLGVLAEVAEFDHVVAVDVERRHLSGGRAAGFRDRIPGGTHLIASTHDFEKTPPLATCRHSLRAACEAGDIGKVALTATDRSAALRVLRLADWAAREDLAFVTIAMGEPGRFTRAVAPLFGSRLTYAPVRGERSTAPGQYDLQTLVTLLDRL